MQLTYGIRYIYLKYISYKIILNKLKACLIFSTLKRFKTLKYIKAFLLDIFINNKYANKTLLKSYASYIITFKVLIILSNKSVKVIGFNKSILKPF